MSQYVTGQISISSSNGLTVTGIGTEFLYNVRKGDILIIDLDEAIPHIVDSVTNNTSLQLSAPYFGRYTDVKLDYSITRIFITKFQFPIIDNNYKSFATLITLFLRELDCVFKENDMVNPNAPVCGGEGYNT